ncbi:hypothetical protein AB0C04_15010 [Micromonospora sp. NPDC048909]|uniref:hypothetical protein n=1 Tax=Micromonospora sp. NPDC048909 TaxID=3155643 RepID=UPI0033C91D9B
MSSHLGTQQQRQPPDRQPRILEAEHGWLAVAAASAAGFTVAYLVDQTTLANIHHGAYIGAGAVFIAGGGGYLIRSAERRVRRESAAQLAELTSQVRELRRHLARRQPSAVGHMYMSHAVGQSTVGIRPATVDGATDPALERAREDGIEQGFDLGVKVQLADMGVIPLQRRQKRRLTGDS